MLKFSRGNAKLNALENVIGGQVWTFSLLSGHTCPFAHDCLSKAIDVDGKKHIEDGPHTQFRCFSASQEVIFPGVYNSRKHNWDMLRDCKNSIHAMTLLLLDSIPRNAKAIRIHVGGDFFSLNYMIAWIEAARLIPAIHFYGYTKSLPLWVHCRDMIPSNFVLTASRGGKRDDMIGLHGLREARVVFSVAEAESLGLPIDHDDSHAYNPGGSFALLLHGIQPKGTEAAEALKKLDGLGSYGKGNKDV